MKKSYVTFAFAVTLLSFAAVAGLRGVGLGGGFGEMQAHLADERLPELLEACARVNCGVREDEVKFVASDRRALQTDTTCTGTSSDQNSVTVSSCDLYRFSKEGQIEGARPFNEIAAVVFSARTGRPLNQSLELLRDLELNQTSTALTGRDSELSQHYLEIRLGNQRFSVLALEGLRETVDVSQLLEAELGCANPSWELGRTTTMAGDNDRYLSESTIRWSCGGKLQSGKLKLFVHYPNHEIRLNNIQLQLL